MIASGQFVPQHIDVVSRSVGLQLDALGNIKKPLVMLYGLHKADVKLTSEVRVLGSFENRRLVVSTERKISLADSCRLEVQRANV